MSKQAFIPSKYQQALFDFIKNGQGNALVSAVAGSGKSTSLIQAMKLIPITKDVHFFAFGRDIVADLKTKIPGSQNVSVSTIHSYGMKTVMSNLTNKPEIDDRKYNKLVDSSYIDMKDGTDSLADYRRRVMPLIHLIRVNMCQTWEDAMQLSDKYDVVCTKEDCQSAMSVIRLGMKELSTIDMTDMIWLPVALDMKCSQFDFVMVDECQDLSELQRALVMKAVKKTGRWIAVGDECQPGNTRVSVVRKTGNRWHDVVIDTVRLDMLKVGDRVVSYVPRDSSFVQAGKKVTGISCKPYSGVMVGVSMVRGLTSTYTANHICHANFSPLRSKYCLYIMRKGDLFRVGKCKMDYGTSSGLISRAGAEGADAAWILQVFDNERDALIHERIISAKYGIPELVFKSCKWTNNVFTEDALKYAWNSIAKYGLVDKAAVCLGDYNRDIRYPIWKRGDRISFKRPMNVRASNLIDGCLMLPYHGKAHSTASQWEPISVHSYYDTLNVYSIDVEDTHLYVADGILTHNCQAIFGFAGADAESFEKFRKMPNTTELPLSVCYRCPAEVIHLAQSIVSYIEPRDSEKESKENTVKRDSKLADIQAGDLILCRNTYPLVKLGFQYIAAGIKARIAGRDIGKNLITMIKNTKASSFDQMYDKFAHEMLKIENELIRIKGMTKEEAVESNPYQTYKDKVDAIRVVSEGCSSIYELQHKIEGIFSDENGDGILLSTIHKAKGLEADNVYIIHEDMMPSKSAKLPWQKVQEQNLIYVAYTRAKKKLGFVQDFNAYGGSVSISTPKQVQATKLEPPKAVAKKPAVGETICEDLQIVDIRQITSSYGATSKYVMKDSNGNYIVKIGSMNGSKVISGDGLKIGSVVRIKAPVKNISQFNGVDEVNLGILSPL